MKNLKIFILLSCLVFSFIGKAQNSYKEAIQLGDRALRKGQYRKSINMYDSAEAFDPSKRDFVRKKRGNVFDKIEALRRQAVKDKKSVELEKNKAIESERKANKLVNAFYFYGDRFALAFKDNRFYFIDKNGAVVKKLDNWEKAEQFDSRGFAKVKKYNSDEEHLLDTLGNIYRVVYDLKDLNKNITALDLSKKKLEEIPPSVFKHLQLKVLLLSENKIIKLPPLIAGLKNLTRLDLWRNQMSSLPSEIGELKNLTALDLSSNKLSSLPAEIGGLKNLTSLNLRYNQLSSLPPEFGGLKNLTSLNLRYNQLSSLPTKITELKNLTHLDLSSNKLSNLPAKITGLKNLTSLDLRNNQLSSLPANIGGLKNLTRLDLEDNQLSSLPAEIGESKNLTRLGLSSNKLSSLPAEIGELKNLTYLGLSSNKLSSLPPEIGGLKNLTYLDLSSNQLSSLPSEIGELKNLTYLDLSSNQLSSLPPEIGELKNLTYLDLSSNQLSSLPPEIGELKNLTRLDLRNNTNLDLVSLFRAFTNFSKEFMLTTNEYARPNTPNSLMILVSNKLSSLPPEIGRLKNLTRLDLEDNQLSSLPPEIGGLKNLTYLNLEKNPISKEEEQVIKRLLPNCKVVFSKIDYISLALAYFTDRDYTKAYEAQQKASEENGENSSVWFGLSWYALFADKPKVAISAAQKTLSLSPSSKGVETNLALAYLLDNQWAAAEKVYHKWKGKNFPSDTRLCDDVFLKDIKDLEKAGVKHKNFAKVKTLFGE